MGYLIRLLLSLAVAGLAIVMGLDPRACVLSYRADRGRLLLPTICADGGFHTRALID